MKREPDFTKCDGLLPAVVQDARNGTVLMLGYMNEESYSATLAKGLVTFFSRSRNELWTKGETSGNFLKLTELSVDCDRDTILVKAIPSGPTCHEGTLSCFADAAPNVWSVLTYLEDTIKERKATPSDDSYTSSLFKAGIDKIAQKVGEEGIEVVIEGKNDNKERLLNESADLLFHLMVLWEAKGVSLADVCGVLAERSKKA
jgi:phosphoribosyl-ATP pyrophosphohydrolase/phosphoribosyl-AMP cyclohydrolase